MNKILNAYITSHFLVEKKLYIVPHLTDHFFYKYKYI